MTETAKIELSNEENTLESIAIAFGAPMVSDKFRAGVGKILENSEKYHGIFTLSDDPITTDKLSVEKLQEHLLPYKKEMVQKIIDEKMQLVTADEFVKLHKESLTAIREKDELQEQLNTAKYFFKNILDVNPNLNKGHVSHLENCVRVMKNSAQKALAAIGGNDE